MQKQDIKISISSFSNICRVCLTESHDLVFIYDANMENGQKTGKLDVVETLKKYCSVDVSPEDNKPQKICKPCMQLLCQSYHFFEKCTWSNKVLDGVLLENHIEKEYTTVLDKKDSISKSVGIATKTEKKNENYFSDSDDNFVEYDNDQDSDYEPEKEILSSKDSKVKVEFAPDFVCSKRRKQFQEQEKKTERKTRKRKTLTSTKNDSNKKSKRSRGTSNLRKSTEEPKDEVLQLDNFECRLCEKYLIDINTAIEHYENYHILQTENYECVICIKPKSYKKKENLLYHMGLHSEDSCKCIPCRRYFKNEELLRDHLKECIKAEERKAKTDRSEESDNENDSKPEGVKNSHKTQIPQKILKETQFDGAFSCQLCKKDLGDIDTVIEHYEKLHLDNLQCIICLRTFTKTVPLFHLGLHSKKSHICRPCRLFFRTKEELDSHNSKYDHDKSLACRICGKKFTRNYKKNKHMLSHLKEKNYSCNKCGKKFTYKTSLVRHFKMHFGKRFLCSACGNAYTTKFMLQRHFTIMHKNVDSEGKPLPKPPPKPVNLQCEFCGEIFTTKYGYGRHIRRHPEFNQYKCKICSFMCDNKEQLEEHMEERHNKHTCKECGKRFPFESELKSHFRKHEDMDLSRFRCEVCGKTARTQTQLKVHLRIHTGERPFSCQTCGKSFKQTAHLKVHMYQHTGKMPYKCEICEKTYPFQHIMEIHMRTHTGEKPFQCMFCGNAYHDRTTMQKHQKKKHPEMGPVSSKGNMNTYELKNEKMF